MVDVFYSSVLGKEFLGHLKADLEKHFSGCRTIAVKMHFGEPGNEAAFKPGDIEPILDVINKAGFDHFLFDSSVGYGGVRSDPLTHKDYAEKKGYKNVITGDESSLVKGKYLDFEVCNKLSDADAVLVLTHFKGHECCGFGGAIKNLGMGALTKSSKSAIHDGGKPVFSGECKRCGICVKNCPINGMKLVDTEKYPVITSCYGCSNCAIVCPHDVIKAKVAYFDELLSDGANTAQSTFKKKFYLTVVKNVSIHCDCYGDPGAMIAKDFGYLSSSDAVAIDKAAYDIIIKADGEIFLKHNKRKGVEHIEAAERLGMGNQDYDLNIL